MNRTLTLIGSLILTATTFAQDQTFSDCLLKTSSRWGAPCEKCESYIEGFIRDYSGTYQIDLKNSCREVIEVKVAVQEKNGTWRTFHEQPDHRLGFGGKMDNPWCCGIFGRCGVDCSRAVGYTQV